MGVALRALARREHSVQELQRKLQQHSSDDVACSDVLTEVQQRDWQNDSRFADAYTRSRANRGYGPIRIEIELRERGVSLAVIKDAIARSGIDWSIAVHCVRQKRFGDALPDNYPERVKQMRFLQYRGFDNDLIQMCFESSDED
jgi:regulatory protein